jgi:hypothetical protein
VINRADGYRRLARECLALARTTSTEEARLTLVEMARVWSRLADEQDEKLPPTLMVDGYQPVVQQQQQQQVQPKKDAAGKRGPAKRTADGTMDTKILE